MERECQSVYVWLNVGLQREHDYGQWYMRIYLGPKVLFRWPLPRTIIGIQFLARAWFDYFYRKGIRQSGEIK